MAPIAQLQPENLPQIADDDFACRDRAARLLMQRYGLPVHVARLVCQLASIGPREAAA